MVLLPPRPGSGYHSEILWWQGEDVHTGFFGGRWGWKQDPDTTTVVYPAAQFVSDSVGDPGANIFCAGQAPLPSGKLLVAGGTEPIGEVGTRNLTTFDPLTGSVGSQWSSQPSLVTRRWYPTVTALPSGDAFIFSGSKYSQLQAWGGFHSGTNSAADDSVYRIGVTQAVERDPAVLPDNSFGRPAPRAQLASFWHRGFEAECVFGGRDSSSYKNDIWFLYRNVDQFQPEYQYQWVRKSLVFGSGSPSARCLTAAVDMYRADTVLVYGGLEADGALGDVWQFTDQGTEGWLWTQRFPAVTEANPGARYGHGAVWDDTHHRLLVFGGSSIKDSLATENAVYALNFPTCKWTKPPVGGTPPAARLGHSLTWDAALHQRASTVNGAPRAILFGGQANVSGTATLENDAWNLWIHPDPANDSLYWQQVVPSTDTLPQRRAYHAAAMDEATGWLTVVGGDLGGGGLSDTVWTLAGNVPGSTPHWTPRATPLGIARTGLSLVQVPDPYFSRVPEVFHPGSGSTGSLSTHVSSTLYVEWFPFDFVLPSGKLFNAGPGSATFSIHPSVDEAWAALPRDSLSGFRGGSAVMYRPGKVMKCGTRDTEGVNAVKTTRVIDLSTAANEDTAHWLNSTDMDSARATHNLTLLPSGEVLVSGGHTFSDNEENATAVRTPELWDPNANSGHGAWYDSVAGGHKLAINPAYRDYHSTALLLPDARVLTQSGNGVNVDNVLTTATIYTPPYLFFNDTLAWRPKITGAADTIAWGGLATYSVPVEDTTGIRSACLIRPGAVTHAFDQNQRFVPLTVNLLAGRAVVVPPADSNLAPPGYYLLFVNGSKDRADIPSIARWVQVGRTGLDGPDAVRPYVNSDFSAACDPNTPNGWIVSWTATADDSVLAASGPVTRDNLRKSTSHITDSNWGSATSVYNLSGVTPGSTVSYSMTVGTATYLRLKSVDNANHFSVLSSELGLTPWSSDGGDCPAGGGMYAGGGGDNGASLRHAPGATSLLRPAATTGASSWVENSLLNDLPVGSSGQDCLRLPGSIVNGEGASVRLREVSGRGAGLDAARLLVVDHPSDVSAYVLGGSVVTGTRTTAAHIAAGDGTDLTSVLDGSGSFAVVAGEALGVRIGDGTGASPLVVVAGGTGALQVQVPDGQGGWQVASQRTPRVDPDALVFAAPGADSIRITSSGYASLSYIGRLTVSDGAPSLQTATLTAARSTRTGDVRAAIAAADSVSATVSGPDTLALSYALPAAGNGVREYFLSVRARQLDPQTLAPSKLHAAQADLPVRFALEQNRPNPFAGRTTIRFALPSASPVRLEVFDAAGRRVRTLALGSFVPGYHAVEWDHRDAGGNLVRPGVYLYRLIAGSFRDQKKMALLAN